jgi:Mg-chelatase subunit ChlD
MAEQNYAGIMLDCSGSMGPDLEEVKKALLQILVTAEQNEVPLAIWAFSDWKKPAAHPVVTFGLDKATATKNIVALEAAAGTTLAPAFTEVCQEMMALDGQRTLIVILDGPVFDPEETKAAVAAYQDQIAVVNILLSDYLTPAKMLDLQNLDIFTPQFTVPSAVGLIPIIEKVLAEAAK